MAIAKKLFDQGRKLLEFYGHLLVLLLGLALACSLWVYWLDNGIYWAHEKVVTKLPVTPPVATAPALIQIAPQPIRAASTPGASPAIERNNFFAELGQTGDSFGGLNTLFTAIAGALVAWAGYMQHLTLKQARAGAEEDRLSRQQQEFESLFFRLLELCEKAADRIEGPPRKGEYQASVPGQSPIHERLPGRPGPRGLDSFARLIFDNDTRTQETVDMTALKVLVGIYLTKVYHKRPSALGPYFRLLYQTFKHVAESKLPDDVKVRYANIARGQISDGAVLLLALNGLTSRGYKFVPLIEQFGLLEHLHRTYSGRYQGLLRLGYRNRAFMGSEERKKPGREFNPKPMLGGGEFDALEESSLAEADADAGFNEGLTPGAGPED